MRIDEDYGRRTGQRRRCPEPAPPAWPEVGRRPLDRLARRPDHSSCASPPRSGERHGQRLARCRGSRGRSSAETWSGNAPIAPGVDRASDGALRPRRARLAVGARGPSSRCGRTRRRCVLAVRVIVPRTASRRQRPSVVTLCVRDRRCRRVDSCASQARGAGSAEHHRYSSPAQHVLQLRSVDVAAAPTASVTASPAPIGASIHDEPPRPGAALGLCDNALVRATGRRRRAHAALVPRSAHRAAAHVLVNRPMEVIGKTRCPSS